MAVAWVSPFFKTGHKSEVSNYKPLSLLNISGKMVEKCLYETFVSAGELPWWTQAVHESGQCLLKDVEHNQLSSARFSLRAATVLHFCESSSSCRQVRLSFFVIGWFQNLGTRQSWSDLEQVPRRVKESKYELAPNYCSKLIIRGVYPAFDMSEAPYSHQT